MADVTTRRRSKREARPPERFIDSVHCDLQIMIENPQELRDLGDVDSDVESIRSTTSDLDEAGAYDDDGDMQFIDLDDSDAEEWVDDEDDEYEEDDPADLEDLEVEDLEDLEVEEDLEDLEVDEDLEDLEEEEEDEDDDLEDLEDEDDDADEGRREEGGDAKVASNPGAKFSRKRKTTRNHK